MEVLIVVIACILAINVAYALWVAASEFFRDRRTRREVGVLEDIWRLPAPPRHPRRRPTRALAGALAVVVLGGVAIATPPDTRHSVVSTIARVIGRSDGGEHAAVDRETASSQDAAPSRDSASSASASASAGGGGGGGGQRHDPNPGGAGTATVDEQADGSSTPAVDGSPEGESSPTTTEEAPSPTVTPEPSPTAPSIATFASSAEARSETEMLVTWDLVESATAYTVHRSDGGGAPVLVAEVVAGDPSVVATGLSPGTSYSFTINALSAEDVLLAVSTTTGTTPAATIEPEA